MFDCFPRYRDYNPLVPVWCVTPGTGRTIHRFFDSSPFSPSGRYLACFRLPQEQRFPEPGEAGEVVLVDLHTGAERTVATTRGWEPQMGANINWGADDRVLVFNDVDTQTWTPLLVRLDPLTGRSERVPGGVYHVSPDGRHAAAASLERMRRTQCGYGVLLPDERTPRNLGAPPDDGLFITDLQTGQRRLACSLAQAVRFIPDRAARSARWEVYGFHSKWSPRGDRIMFTIRRFPARGPARFDLIHSGERSGQPLRYDVLTLNPDGTDVHDAVPAEYWKRGGHHTHWFPDGCSLSMNLGGFGEGLRFVRVGQDGSNLRPMLETVRGSGHPSLHPNGRMLLTDAYTFEPLSFGDGTVPIRLVDLTTGTERILIRMRTKTEHQAACPPLRVDPHPAWDATWRLIAFNGYAGGTRRVYVADLSRFVE